MDCDIEQKLSQANSPLKNHKDAVMSQSGLCYGDFETPQLIQKLQIEEHFFEFRDMFNARMREIEESMGHKVNS